MKKKALLLAGLIPFVLSACSSFKDVNIVKCYGDGYSLLKMYQKESGESYIQLSANNDDINLASYQIGGSIGTLSYYISYKIDEKNKKLQQIVSYKNINYFPGAIIPKGELTWRDYDNHGASYGNKEYHKFSMPPQGGTLSYTKEIDLSTYRYLEID